MSSEAFNDQQHLEDILDQAEQRIFAISQGRLKGKFHQLSPILQETFEQLDKIHQSLAQ